MKFYNTTRNFDHKFHIAAMHLTTILMSANIFSKPSSEVYYVHKRFFHSIETMLPYIHLYSYFVLVSIIF